jgi:hypothetical protein
MSKLDSLRLRQCRNILGTGDGGYTQRTIELCEPKGSPEKCEVAFAQGISAKQQDGVLSHDDLFCRMCGVIPGDIDDVTVRKVKFNIEYIVDKSLGGKEELSNLRTLCSTCNQGAKNITSEKPTGLWLLSQVRRAGQDEQLAVLKWLREKFKQ